MGKSNANRWHEMFRSPLSFNCIFMEILLYSNKDRYDSNEEICIGQKFVFFVCILTKIRLASQNDCWAQLLGTCETCCNDGMGLLEVAFFG